MSREAQKQATRARLIEAAREAFTEKGFASATLRDIARRAHVSTGAVFTHFSSKEELLAEVQFGAFRKIERAMHAARNDAEGLRPQLAGMVRAAVTTELEDIDNVLARISASYQWSPAYDARYMAEVGRLLAPVAGTIKQAQAAGEVRPDADIDMAVELIFTFYLRSFRRARFGPDRDAEAITAHVMRGIDVIIDGLRA